MNWHASPLSQLEEELGTNFHTGLTAAEVNRRLAQYGANKLPESKTDSIFKIFARQFKSPLIYILLIAAGIMVFISEATDAAIILFVLFFNAIIGAFQEGKAQNTLRALNKLIKTESIILRDGKEEVVSDEDIVPGDIIILQEGAKVPADARLVNTSNLAIDEAVLTGESGVVRKDEKLKIKEDALVAEQRNMVFRGSTVITGGAHALVVATGLQTAIGQISQTVSSLTREIPLQKDIRDLSRLIAIVVLVISLALFIGGLIAGHSLATMFATVVALAVSIVPEGLPIIITLVLAIGVWRMARKNALIKNLQAVEALGQAHIIAVDKTGTITKNQMIMRHVLVGGQNFEVGGTGYNPDGEIKLNGKIITPASHPELLMAGRVASYAGNAQIFYDEKIKDWKIAGDPTEGALKIFGHKTGFDRDIVLKEGPVNSEIPFDHKTNYHIMAVGSGKQAMLILVGAPETILKFSDKLELGGRLIKITKEKQVVLENEIKAMTAQGLRVIGFAYAKVKSITEETMQNPPPLTYGGLYGIQDSIREEVNDAMEKAYRAGAKVVMISGDHLQTAVSIAASVGIMQKKDMALTGEDLNKMNDSQLDAVILRVSVFARTSPTDKLRIINSYQRQGKIVAMTGDGVNDAPSLVAADLGVAMGKIGTEVAKEAADIILLDDNFGTIVTAIEEGRSIFRTIKKVILYLFSTSVGELLTIVGAIVLGWPLPILPGQIIWLNMITDTFQASALGMEPKASNLLSEPLDKKARSLLDRLMIWRIFVMAAPMAIGSLYIFGKYYLIDMTTALTMSLTVLAAFQWINAWNCKSRYQSIFSMNLFANRYLIGATILVVLLQVFAIYNPFMQKILHTTALTGAQWTEVIIISLLILVVEEIRKFDPSALVAFSVLTLHNISMQVIIYSTPFCTYCKMAKSFFKENNVPFTEKDVAADEKAREDMIHKSGQLGVPVIEVGDKIIIGFDKPALIQALGIK